MKVYLFTLTLFTLLACGREQNESPMKKAETTSIPAERPVIYQMMTRLFSNTNTTNKPWGTIEENGVGKFNDINETALKALKNSGYTHIWYTGAIEHAVLTDYTAFGIPLDDADVVKGRAGSPYAIKDYYDVNPDLAENVNERMAEFEALVQRTHQAGMKVIIDFVPNHVARGYLSDAGPTGKEDFGANDDTSKAFEANNNFYYMPGSSFSVPEGYQSLGTYSFPTKDGRFPETPAKASGNDVFAPQPSVNDWFETIKLNYGVDIQNERATYFDPIPDTWLKMRDILLYWAAKDVDGFRCDMAEMVPVEFWQWVTKEITTKYPEIIFIAEIYNPDAYRNYIFKGGFDYLYDKVELYDTLKHIIQYKASTDDLPTVWQRQEGITQHMLRFLENHDEQRIASPDFAGDMKKGIPMMAASAFMHAGPIMMYFGQEVGEPGAGASGFGGDDGRTTIFDYWGVPEHVKWVNEGQYDGGQLSPAQKDLRKQYDEILLLTNTSEAFREGSFFDLHYYNRNQEFTGYSDRVYAFLRFSESDKKLVVINFSEETTQVNIKLPLHAWEIMKVNKESFQSESEEGIKQFNVQNVSDYNSEEALRFSLTGNSYQIHTIKFK